MNVPDGMIDCFPASVKPMALDSRSRVMMMAPHPDDESLATGVLLQQAVAAGAKVRMVYATDGDDNPWPQRLIERRWKIDDSHRQRWGRRRRREAIAALRELGLAATDARFLGLPDQGLTRILLTEFEGTVRRIARMIRDWSPTHLLLPSLAETHPDHSALALLVRCALRARDLRRSAIIEWTYLVHGNVKTFAEGAIRPRQTKDDTDRKRAAIACHDTQLKMSRRRFMSYATRPECFRPATADMLPTGRMAVRWFRASDGSILLRIRFALKSPSTARSMVYLLGRNKSAGVQTCIIRLPARTTRVQVTDCSNGNRVALAKYRRVRFGVEIVLPSHCFAADESFFVRSSRRSVFLNESGWIEIPPLSPRRRLLCLQSTRDKPGGSKFLSLVKKLSTVSQPHPLLSSSRVTPPLYIALRFLFHRKRTFLLSLSGVVFGVAIFICTQAQTQGFAKRFIDATLGANGAVVLRAEFRPRSNNLIVAPKNSNAEVARRRYFEGITNVSDIMRISRRFSDVVSCAPVLRGTLSARVGFENATIDLLGIDPTLHFRTTNIGQQIIDGKFEDFRNNPSSVIVGSQLAQVFGIAAGDALQLLSPNGEYWHFTVAAVARSGVGAVDSTRIYCQSKIAQRLLRKPYPASMIIYKLRDPERAPALAKHFENLFQHYVDSWQEREEANLQLFLTLRMSTAITVALIILLAGFGIFNVLTMTVLSKVKEIAILRSMGYRRGDISAIFLWQGAIIAAVGSLIGCLCGAFMIVVVAHIPLRVRGLLYTDYFPVASNWRHYLWATLLAIVAVAIASYVPARRAAQLPPVATLRGSSV